MPRVLEAIQKYNQLQQKRFEERNRDYNLKQQNVTKETLELYRKIAVLIKQKIRGRNISNELQKYLTLFYGIGDFDTQLAGAEKLREILEQDSSLKM